MVPALDPRAKAALEELLLDGSVTVAEVAKVAGMSRQAVHRWINPDQAKAAREQLAEQLIKVAMDAALISPEPWARETPKRYKQRRTSKAAKEKEMAIVSQENPFKRSALARISAGKMTVPEAARYARVPVSSIIGWCKLDHIAIPDEYAKMRHRRPKQSESA